jgi:hypothetical protein
VVKNPRVSIGAEIRENSKPQLSPIAGRFKFEKIVINYLQLVIFFLSFSMPEPVPGLGHLAAQLTDEGGQVA